MEFVTDRTARDVERWRTLRDKGWAGMTVQERQEWLGEINTSPSAAKGMYTHNDLNRVESAVNALLARLRQAGYKTPTLITKTDWTYRDALHIEDIERYYNNLAQLRECVVVYPNTPEAPTTIDRLNYKIANDIEKLLADVDECSASLLQSWFYSGDLYMGEV